MLESINIMAEKLVPAVERFSGDQLKTTLINDLTVQVLTKLAMSVKLILNLGGAVDIVGFKNVCRPDLKLL